MPVPEIITRSLVSLVRFDAYLSDNKVLTDNDASYLRKTQVMVYNVAKPILLILGTAIALASMVKPTIGLIAGVLLFINRERVLSSNKLAKATLGLAALGALYFQPKFIAPMLMVAGGLCWMKSTITSAALQQHVMNGTSRAMNVLAGTN